MLKIKRNHLTREKEKKKKIIIKKEKVREV
jgi:hypothetical protein